MTGQMNNIASILNTIVIKFGDRAQNIVILSALHPAD